MTTQASQVCPQPELEALVGQLAEGAGTDAIEKALHLYPTDPRLLFLYGSTLAGDRRYPEARIAMGQAVEAAPEFWIARFQLGFLEYTSGEPDLAGLTWAPLTGRPADDALRLFAEGLMRLPLEDTPGAISLIRRGIATNIENPALNRDMQLLIDELDRSAPPDPEPTSETDLLLRQLGQGSRR
ncbi:hypothetical protein [Brevundimonas sp.]|uniref:tetratricopeptide repeat protein n=1 Tax=Brevundimonas sp. TaxID=1871086 RepID=UPI002D700C9D|nr:hypothetical protein [Brevundimonas sp.]HYC68859.1 hypothetical protein [Brevundimonas sp.]